MESDYKIHTSHEIGSDSQPFISWVPSPPSKRIKKYIYELSPALCNQILPVPEYTITADILGPQDFKDPLTDDSGGGFDDLLLSPDGLFLDTELQLATCSDTKHMIEDDNELFFACATQMEVLSCLEEAIGPFSALRVHISSISVQDAQIVFSIHSIEGIGSMKMQHIDTGDMSTCVSMSWETFERCIPRFEEGNT